MARPNSAASPLDAAAGDVGPRSVEAFKLLSDETRLAILLALWETHEPFSDADAPSFSELLDRVDYDDSANFSYHLGKLEGVFVESTDDGYRLAQAGHKFVRAVIAGAGITETTLEPTEFGVDCWICGGSLAITYKNEHLYTVCRDCAGKFATDGRKPPGTIMGFSFDPAGLANRTAGEIFAATVFRAMQKFTMQMGGLCPDCSGTVEASLHVCESHPSDGICSNCGRRDPIQARWVCTVCKNAGHGPPGGNLILHPRVVAFYAEHGLYVGYDATDLDAIMEYVEAMTSHDHELVSADPPRVRVTVRADGDELRLTVDEEMSVLDVEEVPA